MPVHAGRPAGLAALPVRAERLRWPRVGARQPGPLPIALLGDDPSRQLLPGPRGARLLTGGCRGPWAPGTQATPFAGHRPLPATSRFLLWWGAAAVGSCGGLGWRARIRASVGAGGSRRPCWRERRFRGWLVEERWGVRCSERRGDDIHVIIFPGSRGRWVTMCQGLVAVALRVKGGGLQRGGGLPGPPRARPLRAFQAGSILDAGVGRGVSCKGRQSPTSAVRPPCQGENPTGL